MVDDIWSSIATPPTGDVERKGTTMRRRITTTTTTCPPDIEEDNVMGF